MLVNFVESSSDRQLPGEPRARQVIEFCTHNHFCVLYLLVLDHPREIGGIILKYYLGLPEHPPAI